MDDEDRIRVSRKIERIFESFAQVLHFGSRPTIFLPDEIGLATGHLVELRKSPQQFLFIMKLLVKIYENLKKGDTMTKRELFEQYQDIFPHPAIVVKALGEIKKLLQDSSTNLTLTSSGDGSMSLTQDLMDESSQESGFGSTSSSRREFTFDSQSFAMGWSVSQETGYDDSQGSYSQASIQPAFEALANTESLLLVESNENEAPKDETKAKEIKVVKREPIIRKRSIRHPFFRTDLKKLIDYGYLRPGTDKLEYTDPEDNYHSAFLNRRGELEDNDTFITYNTIESWLRVLLQMKRNERAGLDNEAKRIQCRGRSLLASMEAALIGVGAPVTIRIRCTGGTWWIPNQYDDERQPPRAVLTDQNMDEA